MLSNFRWYRRWKGGVWWLVESNKAVKWINVCPNLSEHDVRNREDYTQKFAGNLSTNEFWQSVINVSVNGWWKESHNLGSYTRAASIMRGAGIEEGLIVEILRQLYLASVMEQASLYNHSNWTVNELREWELID